jgi:hypothetical protein
LAKQLQEIAGLDQGQRRATGAGAKILGCGWGHIQVSSISAGSGNTFISRLADFR